MIDKKRINHEKNIADLIIKNKNLSIRNTYIDNMKIRFYLNILDYQPTLDEKSIYGLFKYQIIGNDKEVPAGYIVSPLNNSTDKNKFLLLERFV